MQINPFASPLVLLVFAVGSFLLCIPALLAATASGQADQREVIWKDRVEVALGAAQRGPWRMNESEFRYVDDPTVALTDQGAVGVAWADQSRQDIFFLFEPDGRQRFADPVNVSRSPEIFSWLPRMVMNSNEPGEVFILWQEIVFSGGSHGGEIFFARSTDGGKSFSEPVNLSNSKAGDGKGRLSASYWHNGSLDLVQGPQGTLYAAWTEYQGALWFSRSTDRGRSFSDPTRVAGDDLSPARGPSLAIGTGGDVYLAWTLGEDPAADIHYAVSKDGGQSFGQPRLAIKSAGHSDAPKIAVDGKGVVHMVYAESPAGPLHRYHIRYARLKEEKKGFIDPREISAPQTEEFTSANFPSLALDGKGNLLVLWELFPDLRGRSQGLGYTVSQDGGQTFTPPRVLPGSLDPELGYNGSQQGLLMRKLAVNEAGGIAVVNSTFKLNEESHIWLIRGRLTAP